MSLITRGLGDQRRGWLVARGLGGSGSLFRRVAVCTVRWVIEGVILRWRM